MKIVFTDSGTVFSAADIDIAAYLSPFGEVTFYEDNDPALTAERIRDADAVLCNKTVLGKAEMDSAPNLKYIGLFATGYNNIDTVYAREKGIDVCNAGEYSTMAVAQHTFALMLELTDKVGKYNAFVKDGGWKRSRFFSIFEYPTCELYGKTLGIVGYGSIGRAVANIALAFGMKVVVYTRTPREDSRVTFTDLQTLLATADFVSCHTPLTAETTGLFDEKAFASMKQGAYFINTSRGGVVVEEALAEAVRSGHLAGAAVDVVAREPMAEDCPLCAPDLENILITPHVAWAPLETRLRLLSIVCSNLQAWMDGTPKNVVN
ncbi:MAG: D-2-hydroxyacid dehydrogenase [Clostridia bacterium]|nr:D-2-hydroxyacid dehydrogenase [Clostridia bacterium]